MYMLRKWGTLVLLLLVTPVMALAQNTGKLAGRVFDASTGEPLPGANVVLVGTQLGTATDIDGNYFILGVPVGSYDVQASFVGYQAQTVNGVEINSGYTRELNFSLAPGAQLDEVVVEYERPLIQKDALGAPRVVTAEEIQNLPIRGVTSLASVQAGVVSNEGSSTLNIRGGRGEEVTYYVDGVKVVGNIGIAQQAIAEQEMLIGGLPARYGDAMGGVISVSTKSGAPRFFGSLEGVTSEALDPYGYNLASLTVGGPIVGNKLSFFLAGEVVSQTDQDPSAIPTPRLDDDRLNQLLAQPQVIQVQDAQGNLRHVPFPAVPVGASYSDVVAALGLGAGETVASLNPTAAALQLDADEFTFESAKPNNESFGFNLNGNVSFQPMSSVRVRVGGQVADRDFDGYSYTRSIFNASNNSQNEQQTYRGYVTWTHYLSASTFYQLQADYTDFRAFSYDDDFSRNVEDILFYGDLDHASNQVAANYRQLGFRVLRDGTEMNVTQISPTDEVLDTVYVNQYQDGTLPQLTGVYTQFSLPGAYNSGYAKSRTEQLRLSGHATTQIGLHQLEFGAEFEQRTQRAFSAGQFNFSGVGGLARYYNDGSPEAGAENAVTDYNDLAYNVMKSFVSYYGYNYLGTEEVDSEDITGFTDRSNTNLAPYKPIYYAGYISDKIEYQDLVLQIGFRVDVFDNNQRVLRDPYALSPIVRVEDVGGAPSGIGSDYAVYFSGNNVVGYRDVEGNFYNTTGQVVQPNEVVNQGKPRIKEGFDTGKLYPEVFTDYEPQVSFQPRIGMSFPVTDQALFFAHYDVLTQRPTTNQFTSLEGFANRLESAGNIGNPGLEPQKTTEYELGFRQRLGENSALTLSGFYRQIDNLIQLRALKNVFPNNYSTYRNVDFGTVKGAEIEFDLRRTNNVALNLNYTLSFAEGTGSDARTTSNIFWLREANPFVPTFLSPLDFDRRHTANLSLDYRLGTDQGPELFGARVLENFGFNVLATFKSGQPYSALLEPYPIHSPVRLTGLQGEINGQRLPASTLINLRVDREFALSDRTSLTAYLWVQNLLDDDNVLNVYGATGLADDDGYLDTAQGASEFPAGSPGAFYYSSRLASPFNYGIPRMTRLGMRLTF